ncbi:BMP family lipoprotein [Gracilibacillus xinjiangensis]|uniref:BMP family protein n=1 Tax=Gracilibacillus xinjiangensis TaxID=1193282 RepID=A0ABV8X006_9BACI
MKIQPICLLFLLLIGIIGCSQQTSTFENKTKIGIMLSDVGLGDQSFSDSAFYGLEQARDQLGILFDYRELAEVGDYETGLKELIMQGNDLVIGLGYMMVEELEKVAQEYPEQQFVIVDGDIDLPNVMNVNFKEQEGSFLIGAIAGLKTNTDTVGFIGGEDTPLIRKFLSGFKQGVAATNPDAEVLERFAGSFGNDKLGEDIAFELIVEGADYLYPAAGFTGTGVIKKAQEMGAYSFGVDSDQYYLGEETVVSSMMKNIDVAMYRLASDLVENGHLPNEDLLLGLDDNGVGIAPVRVISMTKSEKDRIEELTNDIISGSIAIRE